MEPETDWTQRVPRPGIIDLGPGYPDPDLLPVDLLHAVVPSALRGRGREALSYGANAGPAPLRAYIAKQVPGATADDVVSTAGTSSALSVLAARLARQGSEVLTEGLTYDLARQIFTDRGVPTRAVHGPLDDLDIGELAQAVKESRRVYGVPPTFYVMPTLHNPTGRTLSRERRLEILELAQRTGLRVIEDHAYSSLAFDGVAVPKPLWSLADDRRLVVTLVSLSKSLAPGLRVGGLVADRRTAARLSADGERLSGGGPSHFVSAMVSFAAAEGLLDARVPWLRQQLRLRRDTLVGELRRTLPDGYPVRAAAGGYFVWLGLPPGVDEQGILRASERAGVSFAPGSRFGTDARGIRLCFACCGPGDLVTGARRLAGVLARS